MVFRSILHSVASLVLGDELSVLKALDLLFRVRAIHEQLRGVHINLFGIHLLQLSLLSIIALTISGPKAEAGELFGPLARKPRL